MSQITVHILDTATGKPATQVAVALYSQNGEQWDLIAEANTNSDGRVADLLKPDRVLPAANYRMHFATADYFSANNTIGFYPWVDIVFSVSAAGDHYHIPLLLSPYGYSTYRGS